MSSLRYPGWGGFCLVTASAAVILVATLVIRQQTQQQKNQNKKASDKDTTGNNKSSTTSVAGQGRENDAPVQEITTNQGGQQLEQAASSPYRRILTKNSVTIVHASVTGGCKRFADALHERIEAKMVAASASASTANGTPSSRQCQIASTEDFDWWDELINDDGAAAAVADNSNDDRSKSSTQPALLIVLIPTYTRGTWPPCAEGMSSALEDVINDWRVAKFPLKGKLQVAVFGMGSSEYGDGTMGKPAKQMVQYFQQLGAKSVVRLQVGDDAVERHAEDTFDNWSNQILRFLDKQSSSSVDNNGKKTNKKGKVTRTKNVGSTNNKEPSSSCACKDEPGAVVDEKITSCCNSKNTNSNDEEVEIDNENVNEYDEDEEDDDGGEGEDEPEVVDLEDIGDSLPKTAGGSPREMVTSSQASALKKEGYRLIGTHSAVKLCRWTKHQLRGRGGCYKHSFYGITSYQCMEATPSLACANKCVFCWRHHKNPVGKEWRWKTDDPHYIVQEAIQEHVRMINETKGIPGVQLDRWQEAHTVRHCALSLVGEPIMYPRINELLQDLHSRKISTFLVTNGQHPNAIQSLTPVTQLYVSVDAPTEQSLIAIDRPLFSDAWGRLKESLTSLKDRGQRTVARLTVVKGWNSDEVEGYAKLIALGHVSLVEVKGVTFCGKSDASNLNMTNTPWHHEVVELTRTLKIEIDKIRAQDPTLPEYGLACEHKHSCSVLLARVDQFAVDDPFTGRRIWKTWINYDKFHELAARHMQDPSFTFTVQDYTSETPSWALFGSEEEGFDPTDNRYRKKKKLPKYTKFDDSGVPTHDHNGVELSSEERSRLIQMMEEKQNEIGTESGSTVITELKGGEKEILDASLMFRGLTVVCK